MIKLLLQYWSPCMNQKGTLDLLVYLSLQAPTSYFFVIKLHNQHLSIQTNAILFSNANNVSTFTITTPFFSAQEVQ